MDDLLRQANERVTEFEGIDHFDFDCSGVMVNQTVIWEDISYDGLVDVITILRPVDVSGEEADNFPHFVAIAIRTLSADSNLSLVLLEEKFLSRAFGMIQDNCLFVQDGIVVAGAGAGGNTFGYRENRYAWRGDQILEVSRYSVGSTSGEPACVGDLWDKASGIHHRFLGCEKPRECRLDRSDDMGDDVWPYYVVEASQASSPPVVDGLLDDTQWRQASVRFLERRDLCWPAKKTESVSCYGTPDCGFSIAATYTDDVLTVAMVIEDETIVAESQDVHFLAADHVEIWFNPSGYIHARNKEWEFDRTPDERLLQIGVSVGPEDGERPVVQLYPKGAGLLGGAKASVRRTPVGYNLEVAVPFAALDKHAAAVESVLHTYGGEPLHDQGFTAIVSDCDSSDSPAQEKLIGTSRLKWGDPTTLGVLTFKPRDTGEVR